MMFRTDVPDAALADLRLQVKLGSHPAPDGEAVPHPPIWLDAIRGALEAGVCSSQDIVDFALEAGGPQAGAYVVKLLRDAVEGGRLEGLIYSFGRVVGVCRGNFLEVPQLPLDAVVSLAPHAYSRGAPGGLRLLTAKSTDEVVLDPRLGCSLLEMLLSSGNGIGVARALKSMAERDVVTSRSALLGALSALAKCGVVDRAEDEPEGDAGDRMWEFHDLLFHTRTTQGHGRPLPQGATWRFADRYAPEPRRRRQTWPVYRELSRTGGCDATGDFESVLRRRSSARSVDNRPGLDIDSLAGFLSFLADASAGCTYGPEPGMNSGRLYPGAGACHELEVFLVVDQCRGIERGLYYYDPFDHCLRIVLNWCHGLSTLRDRALSAAESIDGVGVLMIITARFERLAHKYEGIAYSLCLKDVGVLFEHMYLVAAALRIDVRALGGADAGAFADLVGRDRFREPAVGEFLIVGGGPA